MTRTMLSRAGDGDEAETSDLNGGRALVAAVLAGAGFWALLVGVTLTLWT